MDGDKYLNNTLPSRTWKLLLVLLAAARLCNAPVQSVFSNTSFLCITIGNGR
jgi:hypothetical protein